MAGVVFPAPAGYRSPFPYPTHLLLRECCARAPNSRNSCALGRFMMLAVGHVAMGENGTSADAIENIRELRRHYETKRHEATKEQDEIAAAYFSGQVSGLIHAEEAIKDCSIGADAERSGGRDA